MIRVALGPAVPPARSVAPSSPASRPSPSGGLTASLDPGCGRRPHAPVPEHTERTRIQQFQVSTEPGDRRDRLLAPQEPRPSPLQEQILDLLNIPISPYGTA